MSNVTDLLDRLAESEVPATPETLTREVHQSLNRMLVVQHLTDFVLRATTSAMLEFTRATLASLWFTAVGSFPRRGDVDKLK